MKNTLTRFYWLDILRGVAALSIVLWHWQHFFIIESVEDVIRKGTFIDKTHYPLYKLFRPFYGQGWRAVQLFFTLSGFIFFWLYSDKIRDGVTDIKKYLILRFSRLYPLHILTFFIVWLGQIWIKKLEGHYFIYTDYSFLTALKNITLTFTWFSRGFSFNGPSWSVSVEMLLYLIFFYFCYLKFNKWWATIIMVLFGYLLRGTFLDQVGSGIMSFFIGGIVYYLFEYFSNKFSTKNISFLPFILSFTVIGGAILWKYILKKELPFYFFEFGIFPTIVLCIALLENSLGHGIGKKIAFIGDLSYSSYLIHFPLQLAFVIFCHLSGLTRAIFYEPGVLFLFYFILILLSAISYNYFEKPMQSYLRKKWSGNSH